MRVRGFAPATPCWAELGSADPAASNAFYKGLFGWNAEQLPDGGTVFRLRGLAVAGVAAGGQPSGWVTYLSTADISGTARRVRDAGGSVLVPPAPRADLGRRALVADSEGAVFGLWERGTFAGAQVIDEPSAVCWSEVVSRDAARAAAFYGAVFGWTQRAGSVAEGLDYREWVSSVRVVAGMVPMDARFPSAMPSHWRTTFEVADCAATVHRCEHLGGRAMAGPLDALVGQYAYLVDPAGAAFGVIELIPGLRPSL
jgi:predicted enzyme related to lactoylglutathione lyase